MLKRILNNWNSKESLDEIVKELQNQISDGDCSAAIILGEVLENNKLFDCNRQSILECYKLASKMNTHYYYPDVNIIDYYLKNKRNNYDVENANKLISLFDNKETR